MFRTFTYLFYYRLILSLASLKLGVQVKYILLLLLSIAILRTMIIDVARYCQSSNSSSLIWPRLDLHLAYSVVIRDRVGYY